MIPRKRKHCSLWINLSCHCKWSVFLIGALAILQLYFIFTKFSTSEIFSPISLNFHREKTIAAQLKTSFGIQNTSSNKQPQKFIPVFSTIIPNLKNKNNKKAENTKKICNVPKLIPGNEEIYKLDYQQFQSIPFNSTPPPCVLSKKNKSLTPTMFAIDFESNLERLNREHVFWKGANCFFKSGMKDPKETVQIRMNSNETAKFITKDKTGLKNTTEHTYVWCESTQNGDTIYEDIVSQVPIKSKVEKRLKNLPATLNPENYPSVLIFGQDSTSHMNFRRYMPRVHDFLMGKLEAIEFNGFNSLGGNTRLSIFPFFSGKTFEKIKDLFDKENLTEANAQRPNFIWNDFSKMGYRTSYGEDCSPDPIFDFGAFPAIERQPVDYDFRKVTLHLEFLSFMRDHKKYMGGCYGPRLTFDVILENLYRTAYTFARRNKPYFHFSWTSELTHDVNYYSKYGEEYLFKTLENLHSNQLLNHTILILLSDHGMRHGQFRQQSRQGFLEERLPILYIALPKKFKEKYPSAYKNMVGNTDNLITAFDLHETMKDILNLKGIEDINRNNGESGEKSVSLFRKISNTRTCDIIGIPPMYCTCTSRTEITVESSLVKIAVEKAIEEINEKLKEYPQCYQLQIESLTNAYRLDAALLNDGNESENVGEKQHQQDFTEKNRTEFMHEIGFKTSPGGGAFYALVVPYSITIKIIEIHRISAYGDDGYCIDVITLKPFCHCKV